METSIVGLEKISRLTLRCSIYEEFYLQPASKPTNHASLEEAFVRLYSAVLKFLVNVKRCFESTAVGMFSLTPNARV